MNKKRFSVLAVLLSLSLILLLAFSFGCNRSKDGEDAKKRVKEKKDVTELVKTREVKLQEIDLGKVPAEAKELEKILLMKQEEVAARLLQYKFDAKVGYITSRVGQDVELTETHSFKQKDNGDFQLAMTNSKGGVFDLAWKHQQVYERVGNAPFRRSTSTGKHLFWREKVYTSLDRYYKYFRGHLKFATPENMTYEGRAAMKIVFTLDPNGKILEEDLPTKFNLPNQYAVSVTATDRILNKNRKRVSSFDEAEGYVIIDRQAKVVLEYKLHGKYLIPIAESKKKKLLAAGVDPGAGVTFIMDADYKIKDIGKAVEIQIPKSRPEMKRVKPAPKVEDIIGKKAPAKTEDVAEVPAKNNKPAQKKAE